MLKYVRGITFLIVPALAACQQVKSSTPLSPSIAGPIAGVEITAPRILEPASGRGILDRDQPVSLVIGNPSSNGVRPYTMRVEVAGDAAFTSIVFKREGVAPGGNSSTSVVLDRLPAGRTYFWRVQADDGANKSDWSAVSNFAVLVPIVIGTPDPRAPVANVRVNTGTPEFRVGNGQSSGPYTQLWYQFQISDNPNFVTVFTAADVLEGGGGETRYTMPQLPAPDRQFYWRVRIWEAQNLGSWSRVESFRSPLPAPSPSPGPSPAPPSGGGGGTPGSCAGNHGPTIIQCIAAKYPQYLVAGISLSQRQHNMEFIRDRIIEAGRCGGLNFGRNLKRGGPEYSIDFLAERRPDGDMGIDIAFDYDNTSMPLRLQWAEAGYGATWEFFPNGNCGG
jgi:hypothetical protein